MIIKYLGRIVEIAATEGLFTNPNYPYTKTLLEEASRIDSRRRDFEPEPIKGKIPSPPGCRFQFRCPFATKRCRREVPAPKEVAPGRISASHSND